jgi:Tfp pilus assembly protein FimT
MFARYHQVVFCLQLPLCMKTLRNTDGGFTMGGIIPVLAMLGAAAAVATPDGEPAQKAPAAQGAFADQVVAQLQRARTEAVATSVPRYAFIFSNRVEIRAAKRSRGAWAAPTTSDPVLHTVRARPGINAFDLTARRTLPSFTLSPTSSKEIVFHASGAASLTDSTRPTRAHLYISNDTVGNSHPDRELRLDIAPASGTVTLQRKW